MPSAQTFATFVATAAVFVLIPGPNVLYIVARTLAEGRRAGVASVLGVAAASLVHVSLAALGLSALLARSAVLYDAVRYAGAAYLVVLGVRALRGSPVQDPAAEAPVRPDARAAFRQGFVVNLLSPKTALFFLALLPQFVDPARGSTSAQVLVLGAVLLVVGLVNDGLYAFGAGALAERLRRRAHLLRLGERLGGLVYLALGLTAALTGSRTAR